MNYVLNDKTVFEQKKQWLKRYLRITKRIERLEEKLLLIDMKLHSPRSQQISDMPKGGTPASMVDWLAQKEETEERINSLVKQAKSIRVEIYKLIDTLEDYRHVEILEQFFLDGRSIEDIADDRGYTVRHTTRFYADAINRLQIPLVTNLS